MPDYNGIKIDHPRVFEGVSLVHYSGSEEQIRGYMNDGFIRILQIEPVEIVESSVNLKIDVSLEIISESSNHSNLMRQLAEYERKALFNIGKGDMQEIKMYLNVEHHYFKFDFDCDSHSFELSSHERKIFVS